MTKQQRAAPISRWRNALWHINRSPLGVPIKLILRAAHYANVRERQRLAKALPIDVRLDDAAEALSQEGYVQLDEVVDNNLLTELAKAAESKMQRVESAAKHQVSQHKNFWTRLLDEDMQDGMLPTDNPFVAYALQPVVIGILSRVFGELPKLDYVLLTLSRHSGSEGFAYSQLWHLDHDDRRVIKLFVYLTDVVDLQDGPFTFLPGPISDRFGFAVHSHRDDKSIFNVARQEDCKIMIAKRLSCFMVETSRCLHMGSRVSPGHQRLLYTATYFRAPRMFPEPPPRFRLTGAEDEVTRLVLASA